MGEMKRRVFVCDAGEEMPTISYEQPGRKRFYTEEERRKHRSMMKKRSRKQRLQRLFNMNFN